MTTATTSKDKKICIGVKASKWNPHHDGCSRTLSIVRNFAENKQAKDGYGNMCHKCKKEFEELKIEFKADQAKAKEKKANKTKARKADYVARKAKEEKEAQEAKGLAEVEHQLELDAEDHKKEQDAIAAESEHQAKIEAAERADKEAEELAVKEAEVDKALDEADNRPEVTWDQVKQVRVFSGRYESKLPKLTGLAKIDENIILFLHSILLNADPDDGLYATREDVQKDLCHRFRVEEGATLKPFTWKGKHEKYIVCRTEVKGYDKVRDKDMLRTTHYNLTPTGIEWYQLWVEENGLPTPIVPKELKKKVPKDAPSTNTHDDINAHDGSSEKGQMDNSIELALNNAQNDKNAKGFYIEFLIEHRKRYKLTHSELGKKIGLSGASISLAFNKGSLASKHFPKIRSLMRINQTPPVQFSTDPKTEDSVNEEKPVQPELSNKPAQVKHDISITPSVITDSDDPTIKMLVAEITKTQLLRDKTKAKLHKIILKDQLYANQLQFLANKLQLITGNINT